MLILLYTLRRLIKSPKYQNTQKMVEFILNYNLLFIIVFTRFNILIAISLRNNTRIAAYATTERITENTVLQINESQLHTHNKQIPTIPIHPIIDSIRFFIVPL